jgi:hypothetical membrane protein
MITTAQPAVRPAGSARSGRPFRAAAALKRQAGLSGLARNRLLRAASGAGMVIPGAFFAVMTVLGQITPHYDAISRFGSELSLGRYGWAMIANFIVVGVTVLGLAAALWRAAGRDRSGRLGALMAGVAGAAFVVAGVFVTDPHGQVKTFHGAMHFAAAVAMFFVAVPAGGLAMSRWLRGSRWLSRYSALTGIATPLLFIATVMSGHYLGLTERVVIGAELAWLTVLAVALRTGQTSAAGNRAAPARPDAR